MVGERFFATLKVMKLWWHGQLRRRTTVIMVGCAMFLLGIVMARFGLRVPLWFVVSLGISGLYLLEKPIFHLILISLAFFGLGLWRGGIFFEALKPYHQLSYQKVIVRGTVTEDAVYAENGQLSFVVSGVRFTSPRNLEVPGKIKIKGYGELAVYKGDELEISGKLYPTRGASQGSIGFAQFQRFASNRTWIDEFRRKFVAGMYTALPEPAASFGMGLLVGQRATLPDDITTSLKMVGLTHIIAVSGYNLTILLEAVRRVMGKRSKLLSTIAAVALMVGFLALTGASASIVRAAVVSGLGLLAWYYGRKVRPMVLILVAAALTAGWNPVYIWSDIGWYLSFLAFFGILILAPQIFKRFWKDKQPSLLPQVAVETLCAEAMTLPLIMFIFGQVSLIGLIANILVVTAIPLVMLLCFVAGLAGMAVPLLAGWFAWPAHLLLTYMLDVSVWLSRLPYIFQSNRYISAIDMFLYYLLLFLLIVLLYKPKEAKWLAKINLPIR